MKITWDWSLDSEAHRIIDTARQIGNGFYRLQHFLPLPWSPGLKYLQPGVYLPLLNYHSIPSFWLKSSRLICNHYPLNISPSLFDQTKSELEKLNLIEPDKAKRASQSKIVIPQVITFLKKISPTSTIPSRLIVHPTYFGTVGSSSWTKDHTTIILYLRIDQGIKTVVECLLTAILREAATVELSATWSETEFLTDWLLHFSPLAKILQSEASWSPTLLATRTMQTPQLTHQSDKFLSSIGAPITSVHAFHLCDNQVYFGDTPITTLTHRELALLQELVSKSPVALTYDEIGNIIFTTDEKFSLGAINKTIERLRTKLETLGISSSYLATASGVGYYLKN